MRATVHQCYTVLTYHPPLSKRNNPFFFILFASACKHCDGSSKTSTLQHTLLVERTRGLLSYTSRQQLYSVTYSPSFFFSSSFTIDFIHILDIFSLFRLIKFALLFFSSLFSFCSLAGVQRQRRKIGFSHELHYTADFSCTKEDVSREA